jgi:hypothetical protein
MNVKLGTSHLVNKSNEYIIINLLQKEDSILRTGSILIYQVIYKSV